MDSSSGFLLSWTLCNPTHSFSKLKLWKCCFGVKIRKLRSGMDCWDPIYVGCLALDLPIFGWHAFSLSWCVLADQAEATSHEFQPPHEWQLRFGPSKLRLFEAWEFGVSEETCAICIHLSFAGNFLDLGRADGRTTPRQDCDFGVWHWADGLNGKYVCKHKLRMYRRYHSYAHGCMFVHACLQGKYIRYDTLVCIRNRLLSPRDQHPRIEASWHTWWQNSRFEQASAVKGVLPNTSDKSGNVPHDFKNLRFWSKQRACAFWMQFLERW